MQSYGGGLQKFSVDTIAPILRRGVLIDVAGEAPLAADFEITPEHLEGADVRAPATWCCCAPAGAAYFEDARRFVNDTRCPGPGACRRRSG